jgi:hypothetical protein
VQIIDHRDEPPGFDGPVFRQAPGRPRAVAIFYIGVVIGVAVLTLALVLEPFARRDVWSWAGGMLIAFAVGGIALAYAWQWRKVEGPDNWLVKFGKDGILINCVSFLDLRVPHAARKGVVLPFSDIQSARIATETIWAPAEAEGQLPYHCVYLELTVPPAAVSALRETLTQIRESSILTRPRHSLVSAPTTGTIRLEWRGVDARITPPVETALRLLSPHVRLDTQTGEGR